MKLEEFNFLDKRLEEESKSNKSQTRNFIVFCHC